MSSFDLAIPVVLHHEGLVSGDAHDPGGPTRYGISLRFLKTLTALSPQQCAVGDINHDGLIDAKDIENLSYADAVNLYRTYWWEPHGYEQINHQALATKALDLSVNMGSPASHRCLQRAVRGASQLCLKEDGILGNQTLHAINGMNPDLLLAAYRCEAAGYYRSLHQPHFEAGWLNRAYA